jgi:hypothetical protein
MASGFQKFTCKAVAAFSPALQTQRLRWVTAHKMDRLVGVEDFLDDDPGQSFLARPARTDNPG